MRRKKGKGGALCGQDGFVVFHHRKEVRRIECYLNCETLALLLSWRKKRKKKKTLLRASFSVDPPALKIFHLGVNSREFSCSIFTYFEYAKKLRNTVCWGCWGLRTRWSPWDIVNETFLSYLYKLATKGTRGIRWDSWAMYQLQLIFRGRGKMNLSYFRFLSL